MALDISDGASIDKAQDIIMKECKGRLDILVNNAGFVFEMADTTPFSAQAQAQATTAINYYGTKNTILSLLPCLKKSILPNGGRIINVSSTSGQLGSQYSSAVRDR